MRLALRRRSTRRWLVTLLAPVMMVAGIVGAWSAPASAYNALACDPSGTQPIDSSLASALNPQLNGKMHNHLTPYNMSCARVVAQTVHARGLPVRAAHIAITTIIVETSMANLDGGDGSSVGLYQQINSWGSVANRTNPVWATNKFLDAMLGVSNWQTRPIGEVCQAVQRSAYPERYEPQAHDGTVIGDALWSRFTRAAQVVINGLDNALYHEARLSTGQWTRFQSLNGFGQKVSIAVLPDGTAQVVTIGADDGVYHAGRHANGEWTAFQRIPGSPNAKDVAIAALPDRTTQVVVVGKGGADEDVVYHAGRNADGSWTAFGSLGTKAKAVDIAGLPDRSSQVVIVGLDDVVYHRGRVASGEWTPFYPLNGMNTDQPATAKDVAIAGLPDSSSQVVIVGLDDVVYHRGRVASGQWTGFWPLAGFGGPAKAKRVSIAGLPDSTSQVLITGIDNVVYHEVRDPSNGSWSGFQSLPGMNTDQPAQANDITID